jgi:hypothetical protein
MTPNVRGFYAALGLPLARQARREASLRCFANPHVHTDGDRHPSTSVSLTSGAWCCHACGAAGGAYDAALARGHTPRSAIELMIRHGLTQRRRGVRPTDRPVTAVSRPALVRAPVAQLPSEDELAVFARALTGNSKLLRRLERERCWRATAIRSLGLGVDRGRVVIPVRGRDGDLLAVLRYQPPPRRRGAAKLIAAPGSRRVLYPAPETLDASTILLLEGEPDRIAGHSVGLPAVAIPGTESWRAAWASRFRGRRVVVLADAALEGRRLALRALADLHADGVDATAADLYPDREDGADLTDWLRARRPSTVALDQLLRHTTPLTDQAPE